MERCLARLVDARKDSVFSVIQKPDNAHWADVFEDWPEKPELNPMVEMEKGASFVAWTLGSRTAALLALDQEKVKLLPQGGASPLPGVGSSRSAAYAIGRCHVPEDGTRVVLEMARAGDYNVLVLDVMLPGKNGYDVSRLLKEDMERGMLDPFGIILITARKLDSELREEFVSTWSKADVCIYKPFEMEDLLENIADVAGTIETF
jgi:CheY-like chemotaxis protein